MSDPSSIARLKAACALVEHAGWRGTGFLVQADCVLTCYHVIKSALPDGTLRVRFSHGDYVGRVELVDAVNDCAAIRLDRPVAAAAPLALAESAPASGWQWSSYGFPAATFESGLLITGDVQDPEAENLRRQPALLLGSRNVTASALMQGFSGSPVLSRDVVIGQLQQVVPGAGAGANQGAQFGVIYAAPARCLWPLLPRQSRHTLSPYRGLSAFQVEDAPFFFGREALSEQLWALCRDLWQDREGPRVLAVLGPSGAGKSSVVRAGLIPALHARPLPGPQPPRIALLKPGEHPLESLTRSLLQVDSGAGAAAGSLDLAAQRSLRQALRQPDEHGRYDGLRLVAASLPAIDSRPLLLVVDQMEEAYTLCKDPSERDAFVALLLEAAADPAGHVAVLFTLRSDYLADTLRQHRSLNQALARRVVVVPAMSDIELRRAICEPAARLGHPLDIAVTELLMAQARGSAGALPLLEFALTRIWDGLRAGQLPGDTLRAIGGVGGALAVRAQELFSALPPAAQRIARRAFLRLSQSPDETRVIRRRLAVQALVARGETEEQVLLVLRHFARDHARLITLSADPESAATLAEVTHEALFEHWAQYRAWLHDSRDDQRLHNRLMEAAQLWVQSQRSPGRLWRPPDLDLLRGLQQRCGDDLTQLEVEFALAAEQQHGAELAAKAAAERRLAEAYEQLRQQLLATYVEQGRQELLAERPHQAALWLHRALEQGSKQPMLPYLLAAATRSLDASMGVLTAARFIRAIQFSPDGRHLLVAAREQPVRVFDTSTWRLTVELVHPSLVRGARFSPDGARIATESSDNSVRIWEAGSGQLVMTLKAHREGLRNLAYSPNGKYLATTSDDGAAWLWDPSTGKLLTALDGHKAAIRDVSFSPDGSRLVTASEDQTARLWSVPGGQPLGAPLLHGHPLSAAQFSPDGCVLATVTAEPAVWLWSADGKRTLCRMTGHQGAITALGWAPDGEQLSTASHDHTARIWAVPSGQLVAELRGHGASVAALSCSPDGEYVLTGSWDHGARLWSARTGQLECTLRGHTRAITAAGFSPDARWAVTASDDHTIRVWDVCGCSATVHNFWLHRAPVENAVFSADGRYLVTASRDRTSLVCETESGRLRHTLLGHTAALTSVACSPDGKYVATAAHDGTARLWSPDTGRLHRELRGHEAEVTAVAFSADSLRLVTASADRTARLWDAETGRSLAVLSGHGARINSACLSSTGERVLTASADGTARLWGPDGRALAELQGHEDAVNIARFSSDGRCVATGSDDGTARLFDAASGRRLFVLRGHGGVITDLAFSPDGSQLVTASRDDTARVWQTATGKLAAELSGHSGYVRAVAFSPDGLRIATASRDGTARLWEAASGKTLAIAVGHTGLIHSVGFNPAGTFLLTGSEDGTMRLWDVGPEVRPAAQIAALIESKSAYHFEGDVIVPSTPGAAASQGTKDLRPSAPRVQEANRLFRLGLHAWIAGDVAAAQAHLAQARLHAKAVADDLLLGFVVWSQAAMAEALRRPQSATELYAEALGLLCRAQTDPLAQAALLSRCAYHSLDRLCLPAAALRALQEARRRRPEQLEIAMNQLEAQAAAGLHAEALAAAEALLGQAELPPVRRLVIACLAWIAATLGADKDAARRWSQLLLRETPAEGRELAWNFTGIRRALARREPSSPALQRSIELIDLLLRPSSVESQAALRSLLGQDRAE